MAASVNVALIGGGLMGSFHAETLARRLPSVRFVVIADPLEAPARALMARLELDQTRYEPDYQTVLADPEIQAVVIATPGATHPAIIAAAEVDTETLGVRRTEIWPVAEEPPARTADQGWPERARRIWSAWSWAWAA